MTLTSCSDEELDRLLRMSDPVDRGELKRDDVLKASDQLFDAVLQEAGAADDYASSAPQTVRRRSLPRPRVILIGGAALAAMIASVFIAVVGSSSSPNGSESVTTPALPLKLVPPVTASVALQRAAYVARRQPVVDAAHRWVYLNTLTGSTSSGGARDTTGRPYGVRFWQTSTNRAWINNHGEQRILTTNLREQFFSTRDAAVARAHGKTLASSTASLLADASMSYSQLRLSRGFTPTVGFFGPARPTQPTALLKALKREERNLQPPRSRPDVTTYGLFNLITGRRAALLRAPRLRESRGWTSQPQPYYLRERGIACDRLPSP